MSYLFGALSFCTGQSVPLDTGQDSRHVIRRAPAVLQDVQAKLARSVDVGVEHLADKFHTGGLVRVLFLKVHHEAKRAILEGSVSGSDDDGIPGRRLTSCVVAYRLYVVTRS